MSNLNSFDIVNSYARKDQECENLICTHPGNTATCSREGVVVTPTPSTVKKTCEQCFTTILTQAQLTALENIFRVSSPEDLCAAFVRAGEAVSDLTSSDLPSSGVTSETIPTNINSQTLSSGI
jgi:hypothetical protein